MNHHVLEVLRRTFISILVALAPVIAGAASPCYLVTNSTIETIQCDFRASTTDALRYSARQANPGRPSRDQRQVMTVPMKQAPPPAFRRVKRPRIVEDD